MSMPPPGDPSWQQPYGPGQPPPYQSPGPQQPYPTPYQPVGPLVPAGLYLDPTSGLMLPNGTALASTGRRIGAYFLAIPLSIITLGIGYVIWALIVWGKGTTPALQVLGMRAWRPETQRPATWGSMALREVLGGIVEAFFIIWLISFIFMLSRPDRRTIHDLMAGTIVVHDPNKVLAR
jgi:uncharacterized RDD family membrane protein YckC